MEFYKAIAIGLACLVSWQGFLIVEVLVKLPSIIKECLPLLRALTNYNVDDVALVNSLNAKLAYMVSLKGIKFKQYNNSISKSLSYYAINFMASGAAKDFTIDCINNYLLDFVEPYLDQALNRYKEQYYEQQYATRIVGANPQNRAKIEQQIEEELDQIRVVNTEIEEANLTGVYEEARQIEKVGVGAIFIRIPELGDYIDSATRMDKDKRSLMKKMKNIYEGTITPSIIGGDKKRRPIKDIPVQALMYTDFENLLDSQNNKFFKEMLKTGYARRCFIYMPQNEDRKINYPTDPRVLDEQIYKARDLKLQLQYIFERLSSKELIFSEEAQDWIYRYKCQCIDKVNKMRHKKSIIATDLSESFWKIQKLSVLYAVLDNPFAVLVDSEHIQMAASFYEAISPSLKYVMDKREKTVVEQVAEYIVEQERPLITKMELRKQKFVSEREFTDWLAKNFEAVKEELSVMGYTIAAYDKDLKGYQIINNNVTTEDII